MAYEWGPRHAKSYAAAIDLTGKQYFIGVRQSNGQITLAGAGQGDGIIEATNHMTAGSTIAIVDGGTTKVKLNGTVAIGDPLISDGTGAAIKYTSGTGFVFGKAAEAGVAGQIIAADIDFTPSAAH